MGKFGDNWDKDKLDRKMMQIFNKIFDCKA